eukprot:CAMPEP_0201547158 /NCGR_PEP_ID=MMETSP0173_2-20130828/3581_1 /ASSEMBLY_ACC=CAM_ASM_000268 /TAXON_ID=218659 /ORGANISM="Vexillifera sp., Strain DIVA3 564/2" /LENGTH=261 /DNA_ID=CAMNT_0047956107 /DNA_START=96 /DNA_END=878 /DNA_ORIENTATION=+
MHFLAPFILLTILFFPTNIIANQCLPFNVSTTVVADACSNILISPFARASSEESLETGIAATIPTIAAFATVPIEACRQIGIPTSCVGGLDPIEPGSESGFGVRQCLWTTSSSDPTQFIPIDQEWTICRDFCDTYVASCKPFFDSVGIPTPNCGDGRFSNDPIITTHPETGAVIAFPCLNYTTDNVGFSQCEENTEGLVQTEEGTCALECPSPILTDDQEDQLWYLHSIVGWFSMVACIFMTITYLIDPMRRRFPHRMALF